MSETRTFWHDDFLHHAFPRTPLVTEDILDAGEKMVIYGESESGKSYLALQLAMDLASGRAFLGFDVLCKCRVGLLQAELSDFRFQERYARLARNYPSHLALAVRTVEDMKIDLRDGHKRFTEWIHEIEPDVVIIDPMRAFFAGSENDSDAVERWFTGIAEAQTDPPFTLIYIHHISKGGPGFGYEAGSKASARGSGLITDRPSTAIGLTVNAGQTEWKVKFTKTRNRTRHPDDIVLDVDEHSGLFVPHGELDATGLYMLRVLAAVGDEPRSQPEVIRELATSMGVDPRTVRDWLLRAEQRGLILREQTGLSKGSPYVLTRALDK